MADGAGASTIQSCQTRDDCLLTDPCVEIDCVDTFCQEVGPVECPVIDPCTAGTCDSAQGICVYEPVTEDVDGDGFLGALPGKAPGTPEACGDDCDDTRAQVLPGGFEECDGLDNDCDGIIDNGSDYLSTARIERDLRLLGSPGLESSGSRDLVYGDGKFVASYWGKTDSQRPYFRGIDPGGADVFDEALVANVNSTSFGADFAFSGTSFGAVLSDNRFNDYEVSFAHFDTDGNKLGPDVWLTDSPGFSTHERLIFDQGRFIAVWDDHREMASGGQPRIFSQIIDAAGNLVGENVPLSEPNVRAELPSLSASPRRFGLVHTVLVDDTSMALQVRTFDKNFSDPTSQRFDVAGFRQPVITALGSTFLVSFIPHDGTTPGPAVRGMLVDERGAVLVALRDLTGGPGPVQTHAVLSLGDRVLLAWADYSPGNYEIFAKVIGLDLLDIEPATRLTDAEYSSIEPYLAITDTGQVGVQFDDTRTGMKGAYFMTLGCDIPPPCVCTECTLDDCPSCCIK